MRAVTATILVACAFTLAAFPCAAQSNAPTAGALSAAQYTALGMPPADHTWTATDFEAAANVVQTLNNSQLPRSTNPGSAAIFQHLIDPAPLTACIDRSADVNARVRICGMLINAASILLHKYVTAEQADHTYRDDTVSFGVLVVQVAAAIDPVGEEYVATLQPSDPTYVTRLQGFQQVRVGEMQIVQGALIVLTRERQQYSEAACLRLAQALADAYPKLAPHFAPESKSQMDASIIGIAHNDPNPSIRAALAPIADASH